MENIKGIVAALCFVSAGIYGVRNIVSDTALSRKAEVILKMVFAVILISPFVNGTFSFELPEFSEKVEWVNYIDGCKVYFENGDFVICRFSGTEPLLRIFAESGSAQKAQEYIDTMKSFLAI